MMILPLADNLQNCFQNLTSRIAGIDNEQVSGRVLGLSSALGYSLGAIKEQFKSPKNYNSIKNETDSLGFNGFTNRANPVINPNTNLSNEKEYDTNSNPIRTFGADNSINNTSSHSNASTSSFIINNKTHFYNDKNTSDKIHLKNKIGSVAKASYSGVKTYIKIGATMAEGNLNKNSYMYTNKTRKNNLQSTEFTNNLAFNKDFNEKLGDKNELKNEK